MTRLSQIIAIEKGVRDDAARTVTDASRELGRTPQLSGISRSYQPRDEDGDALPPESTNVQVRAEKILDDVAAAMTRVFDVTFTKDTANTVATADVTVDGQTIIASAPVPYLLFLEKQFAALHSFLGRLPLLDPSEKWTADETSGAWRSEPARTVRSKKTPRNHVLAEATPEHPAQVQMFTEDVPVGYWTTVKFSGALPAARVRTLTERCAALLRAVKYAREEANATQVTDRQCGEAIFGYLLAP